jgi:mono/diheme cytochrome c family protein
VSRCWAALVVAVAVATQPTDALAGPPAIDYALNCQGCHLANGAGTPGSVPALAGSVAKFLSVPGGREYLVRVPGVAQSTLEDAELAEVLNWMLARFDSEHVPAGFRPYTGDEVGRLRKNPLTNVVRVRSELLAPADPPRP